MNNTPTTVFAAATIPFLVNANDIYLIGMLVIATLTFLTPIVMAVINKVKVKKEDFDKSSKDAQEILNSLKDKGDSE